MVKCYRLAVYGFGDIGDTIAMQVLKTWKCKCLWSTIEPARWEMLICFHFGQEPLLEDVLDRMDRWGEQNGGSLTCDHFGRGISNSLLQFVLRLKSKTHRGTYSPCLNYRLTQFQDMEKQKKSREAIAAIVGQDPTPELCLSYHYSLCSLLQMLQQIVSIATVNAVE